MINPIVLLECTERERDDLIPCEYIGHMCYNTQGDSTSGKYVVKILVFGSGTPEERIIFIDLS